MINSFYKAWHYITGTHLIRYDENLIKIAGQPLHNGIKIAKYRNGVLTIKFKRWRERPMYIAPLLDNGGVEHTTGSGSKWEGGRWQYLEKERRVEQILKKQY